MREQALRCDDVRHAQRTQWAGGGAVRREESEHVYEIDEVMLHRTLRGRKKERASERAISMRAGCLNGVAPRLPGGADI